MYLVACIGRHRKHSASRGIAHGAGGGISNVRDTLTLYCSILGSEVLDTQDLRHLSGT